MYAAPAIGSYVLLIHMPHALRTGVGALGICDFPAGAYAYVGSAMAGFKSRLRRHVEKQKTPRWHIDYLTVHSETISITVCGTCAKLECDIAEGLRARFESFPRFGSSDCHCPSHLFFASRKEDLEAGVAAVMMSLKVESSSLKPGDWASCFQ